MDHLTLIHEDCGGELLAIGTYPKRENGQTRYYDYYWCSNCGELIREDTDPEPAENNLVFQTSNY